MRTLSASALSELLKQESGEVYIPLLTLDGNDLSSPIRVANNFEDVTSRGDTFVAFPFEINIPSDDGDQLSQVTLTISNVDQSIVGSLRTLTSELSVTLEIVTATDPDTVEAGPFAMSLKAAEYDAVAITGTLAFEDILNEPFPADRFTPAKFPTLFQ